MKGTNKPKSRAKGALPSKMRPCWLDRDFSYLENKSKDEQRLAALYEYARESDVLVSAVTGYKNGNDDFPETLLDVYRWGELEFLSRVRDFPRLSFKKVLEKGLPRRRPKGDDVHVAPASSFFDYFERRRQRCPSATIAESSDIYFGRAGGWTYVISIPWGQLPDGEIADRLAKCALEWKPVEMSDRVRPGRRGTLQTVSGMDLLRHLSVFRFQQSGGTFEERSGSASYYATVKGWNLAIRAAEKRIKELPVKHLFS